MNLLGGKRLAVLAVEGGSCGGAGAPFLLFSAWGGPSLPPGQFVTASLPWLHELGEARHLLHR